MTVRNYSDGYRLFDTDMDALLLGIQGVGVISGCVCSAPGTNTTVSWTTGTVKIGIGLRKVVIVVGSLNLSSSQDVSAPRKVIIYVDATDVTVKAVAGVAATAVPTGSVGRITTQPIPPDFSGSFAMAPEDVILCEVWLRPSGNNILITDVTDRRIVISADPVKVDFRSASHEISDVVPTNPWLDGGLYNGPANSMCRAKNGDFLYFNRVGVLHVMDIAVMDMYRSKDQGKTWTKEWTYSITGCDPRNYSCGTTPTGRILLFMMVLNPTTQIWANSQFLYSDDDGYTWSAPVPFIAPTINGMIPKFGINDSPGECTDIIKPMGGGRIGFSYDAWDYTANRTQIRFCWSDDDGITWTHALVGESTCLTPPFWCEPSSAYLGGSRIVCMCRQFTSIGVYMFTSTDNGVTWTDRGSTTLNGHITTVGNLPRLFPIVEPRYKKVWVAGLFTRISGGGEMWLARGKSLINNGTSAWEHASMTKINLGVGGAKINDYPTAWFDGNKGIVIGEDEISSSREVINIWVVHPFSDWSVFPTPFHYTNQTCGLEGTAALPTTGRAYGINYPVMIYCTGGTGMSITITDPIIGTTVVSGLTSISPPMMIMPAYTIVFSFTGTPTITVSPMHSGNWE